MAWRSSKYSKDATQRIHTTILAALGELGKFNGVDMATMKSTSPYSFNLANVSTQKMAAELKKMIDLGLVVKSVAKSGENRKYMLRSNYDELMQGSPEKASKFGYGDYRDHKELEEPEEEPFYNEEAVCRRIAKCECKYNPEW